MAKRLILAILLLLPVICSAQQGYNGKYFITNSLRLGASKDSFARGGSALDVTGLVKFFSYASPDTNTVLGVDGNGNVVLRTKGNGSGGSTDSAVFATLYALYDTAHNLRGYVNGLFTAYYTASQVNNLLGNYYDKTTSDGKYVKYADTTITIATETERKRDSLLAANELAARVKYSDTAAMLLPYLNAINARVKYTDTASMLTAYRLGLLAKLNISDTAAMLAAYQAAILQRVKYGDTASMLANYQAAINARVKYTDTAGMLAAYQTAINNLNANKIAYSDTAIKVVTPTQLNDSLAKENLQAVTTRGRNTTSGITINAPTGAYFTDSFVVCGTSIEYGMTLASPTTQCWPVQMGNMLGYGIINLGVPFANYENNDSLYRRIPPKRANIKGIIFGGPVNDPFNYNDTTTFGIQFRSKLDSLVNYKGYSYSDFYQQTNEFCYRDARNNTQYPRLLTYNKCIRDMVTSKGTNLIDLFTFSYQTLGYWATNDGIHPNYQGAQYIAQYTAGFLPKVQHPDNDLFLANGKVQLGDGIYHRTTKTATANSGIRIVAVDSTGNEVLVNGSQYVQTANILSTESSGGIHTSEDITTDRKLTSGNIQLVPFSLNWWWLGENCYFDYNGGTGFAYNRTGYASKLQMLNGSYILQQAPSGTAGATPAFTESFQFNQDGTCGLGGHGAGNGTLQNYAIKSWGTNFHVSVGNVNSDPGEVLTAVGNIWAQGRNFYIDAGKIAMSTFSGSPESSVIAPIGSIYFRNDGGDGTSLYSKTSGTGSTGWKAIPTVTQLNLKVDSVYRKAGTDSVFITKNSTSYFAFRDTIGSGVGLGSVTSVSVVNANGFNGTVATSTTTPAITLTTTVTGLLKGNGTAISAATSGTDYTTPSSTETVTNKSISGSTNTLTNIPNSALTNSTISGVSLGSNLFAHTLGYGLTGTSYNGSAAVTTVVDTGKIATQLYVGNQVSGYTPTTRAINTTSPLTGGGNLSADRTIAINDAAADGTTKGASSYTAADFNSTTGLISIDYTNGQAASTSNKGFLTNTDWNTFNGKQAALTLTTTGTGAATLVGATLNIPTPAGGGGSPGGSTNDFQYNNAGAFAAVGNVVRQAEGYASFNSLAQSSTITAPTTSGTVFHRAGVGLTYIDKYGYEKPLQTDLGFINRAGYEATEGGFNNSVGTTGNININGTYSQGALSGTSAITKYTRSVYTSAATAGSKCELYASTPQFFLGNTAYGGGMEAVFTFGAETFATTSRLFDGFESGGSGFSNADPSTFTNIIGISKDISETSNFLQFVHNDATGTATKVSTGVAFDNTAIYELVISVPPNSTTVDVTLYKKTTSGRTYISSAQFTSDLPAAGTFLNPHVWINNGTVASAIKLDFFKWSIQYQ